MEREYDVDAAKQILVQLEQEVPKVAAAVQSLLRRSRRAG
jgi:hypothetical protein